MKERKIFYKQLTMAELGEAKTHEKYIRFPNDFDYKSFFGIDAVQNDNVLQLNIDARYNGNPEEIIPLKFVYYANSNKEKRMPSLGTVFDKYRVRIGSVFALEVISDNGISFVNVSFKNANEIVLFTNPICYTEIVKGQTIDNYYKASQKNLPLQQIFFGAPGTGKSYEINESCAEYENYRTTFHPDTDYASFVGSYKPITEQVPRYTYMGDKAIAVKDETGKPIIDSKITYRYVFQSFLKAYIAAWKEQENDDPKPVFLIIEEINRGNCAQIFGDIFQLLDRNENGFSDYPIVADDDLAKELGKVLGNLNIAKHSEINNLYKDGKDVVGSVLSGEKLLLPNNMYIWATMNTSDQSLFPIDSAFKRRWDWKYVKIKNADKDYRIVFSNGNEYDWWQFVCEINRRIEGGEIQQEDKKLGYFFAKAKMRDGKSIITAETFLSKVIFYLYNDVFKDFGFEDDFFKDANGETMTFASYFDDYGNMDENRVEQFIANLGLEPLSDEDLSA